MKNLAVILLFLFACTKDDDGFRLFMVKAGQERSLHEPSLVEVNHNSLDFEYKTDETWAWSFPGASPDTSNLQNPKVEYPTAGTYSVSLYVTNADSSDTEIKTNYITVRDSVVADFSASAQTGNTGVNITFADLTTNNPSSWAWSFPGGTPDTSNLQNPTVQYNTAGTYTVTLEATNTCNSDTETKTGHITVSNPYAPAGNYRLTIKFR